MGRVAAVQLRRNLVVLFMLFIAGCCLFHALMAEARAGNPGGPSAPWRPDDPRESYKPPPPCCK